MLDRRSRLHRFLEAHSWVILALSVLGCALLGLALVRLDELLDIDPDDNAPWLYGGSADAAIGVLSAIASSAITVAGVVFSATFVTMQLASSQYTPRVVQTLNRRWYLQSVLGMFLGSFAFSLLVLRSVRPATDDNPDEFMPVLAVSVAILIALVSVGVLIFYIIYGMRSLEPTALINSAAIETIDLLERSRTASDIARSLPNAPKQPPAGETPVVVRSSKSGFLQLMQFEQLLSIAREADITVDITASIGHFRYPGEELARVWPASRVDSDTLHRIQHALLIGPERTPEQDIEFGFRRVADIMLKALSAAINDPTTAEYCMNTLGNMVILVANEPAPQRYLVDRTDVVRVIWKPEPYARCVHTAFDQLRFYIRNDTHLSLHALETFRRIHALVPIEAQPVIVEIAHEFVTTVRDTVDTEADRMTIDRAALWIQSMTATS